MSKKTIWAVTVLISVYVMAQLVADVTAGKIVQLGSITLPAATFIYAVTFTWRDLIHKRLGREWARAAIGIAAVCNVAMVLYFKFVIWLNPAVFWGGQEAFTSTLGVVFRIAMASILSEVVSQLIDTEVYQALMARFAGKAQWVRVLGSNAIALPVDSLVFVFVAFWGTMPATALLGIAWGQIIFKAAVTLASLPAIYLVRERPLIEQCV